MSADIDKSAKVDALGLARERVSFEFSPSWVIPYSHLECLKTKNSGSVTHLLMDRQVHAELNKTYVHVAIRLETLHAVQNNSQWRLEFEPLTQAIAIHSIKIWRDNVEFEYAQPDRIRFLQREAGLDKLVIDGWVTLLLLLEDVRAGDILEWSYTVENRPRLLPGGYSGFFPCAEGMHIGKYHLSVRFAETRPLKWKSSSVDLAPAENHQNAEINWVWMREDFSSPEPEERTPQWCLAYPWVQVSDSLDWKTVAVAFSEAWKKEPAGEEVATLVREITAVGPEIERQVNRAIQLVQDDIRYLSVNLELGGQVPADAGTVIRRRYGDCKDLAFLLVELLKRIGVSARPVLVNTVLRKSLNEMLPSANLFNHAVVEYELQNEIRWVGATMKRQGGGPLDRIIPDFGYGLPLDDVGSELIPQPPGSSQSSYELKEHFLLDTTGDWSHLARIVTARGLYAENLRLEFENEGLEAIEKKRLQACEQKFSQARRVGALQYRDERELNRFVIAEVFEINGFFVTGEISGQCHFYINHSEYAQVIPLPAKMERRTPYALAHPCKLVHVVEIESLGLGLAALPAFRFKDDFFEFTCASRAVRKFTSMTLSLTTLSDAVTPGRLAEYKKNVERAMGLSGVRLRLPIGHSRLRKRGDFGALPPVGEAEAKNPSSPRPQVARPVLLGSPTPKIAVVNPVPWEGRAARIRQEMESTVYRDSDEVEAARRASKRRSRPRSRGAASPGQRKSELIWILGFVVTVALIGGFLFLIRHR